MLRLEDLVKKSTQAPIVDESIETNHRPEYLFGPEIVGYPTREFQTEIYNWALGDTLIFNPLATIGDVGCGRGDLFRHIQQTGLQCGAYHGYELAPGLVQIGRELTTHDNYSIYHGDYLLLAKSNVDYTFVIGSLNTEIPNVDKWEYLDSIISEISKYTHKESVLIMQNTPVDGLEHWPIEELIRRIKPPFKIDFSKYEDIYKVTFTYYHLLNNQS